MRYGILLATLAILTVPAYAADQSKVEATLKAEGFTH